MSKVTKTHASVLVNKLVVNVKANAERKYNCSSDEQAHFALGYMVSVLERVAGSSPKAFAELQEVLKYTVTE